jgi:hypothetical protein
MESFVPKPFQKRAVISGLMLAGGVAIATGYPATAQDKPAPAAPASAAAVDPMFSQPYIDKDEWRDAPVRHRYVHGGFKGTDTRFSFYFPPKSEYQGRFFQYITPVPDSENLSQNGKGEEDKIGFSVSSGAYFIETNGGGAANVGMIGSAADPTISAYRANAATARYSRVVAMEMYGPKRPYGYAFGGSGGAYRTIGSIEHTIGVWDGAVPFVIGSSMAAPNMFTVRMHAMRILKDKFPQIVDAVEPGGSGDPYAGLNEEQAAALREVTRMGFPTPSWFGYKTMGIHAFGVLYPGMVMADPKYFEDFWTKSGYLGFDHPESFAKDRIQFKSTIRAVLSEDEADAKGIPSVRMPGTARGAADTAWQVQMGTGTKRPVALQLAATPPEVGFLGGDLIILTGAAAGKRLNLRSIAGDSVVFGVADNATLAKLAPGDEVQVDNSNFLAAQTYHRHQVPGPEFKVWDQFRGADGKPIYPQRPFLLGPVFTAGAAGTVPTGKFQGKMIALESLWDREAMPWQGDWYRYKVQQNLGDQTNDNFRLWFTDHALHGDFAKQEDPSRTVSYLGVLQQALRDLSAWVEKGTPPPATTNYQVVDGQVLVAKTAAERKGIQPVVTLKANGGERAEVAVGQPVSFTGTIDVPPGAGSVVAAEWDFDGAGTFATSSRVPKGAKSVTVTITHSFAKPGTYFPALRGISQRQGDATTPFARIQNLGRARVVVK